MVAATFLTSLRRSALLEEASSSDSSSSSSEASEAPSLSPPEDDDEEAFPLEDLSPPLPLPLPLPCFSLSSLFNSSIFFFSFFSFIRRFWNQILICLSVRQRACEISMRRRRVKYLLNRYSFSNSNVW